MTDICAFCEATGSSVKLNTCAGCGLVKYCSREHQRSHWKTHKADCRKPGTAQEEATTADATAHSDATKYVLCKIVLGGRLQRGGGETAKGL